MTQDEWDEKFESLPCNGQEGQPCRNGCIMAKERQTGKLILMGDCRAPYDSECALNKQREKRT